MSYSCTSAVYVLVTAMAVLQPSLHVTAVEYTLCIACNMGRVTTLAHETSNSYADLYILSLFSQTNTENIDLFNSHKSTALFQKNENKHNSANSKPSCCAYSCFFFRLFSNLYLFSFCQSLSRAIFLFVVCCLH